jgi:uncharacterized surface protein with fasciclin (FAS1) repeats
MLRHGFLDLSATNLCYKTNPMKTKLNLIGAVALMISLNSCDNGDSAVKAETAVATAETELQSGQANVVDDVSQKDIVKVAIGSPDHSTLVAAVKAADLVNALSNAGPFTVFAPTNAAFDALPAGTVDDLLKAENKDKLADILQYHVSVSVFDEEKLTDGLTLGQVNGGNIKVTHKDGKIMVNDATIIGTVKASNGIIHVIDKVLLPK